MIEMIKIGKKIIKTKLEEGYYQARIKSIKEAQDAVLQNGSRLPAIEIEYELKLNDSYLNKSKRYIATDREGSELRKLLEILLPQINFEEEVDLEELIGKRCKVEIIENISKKNNRFSNIGTVKAADLDE